MVGVVVGYTRLLAERNGLDMTELDERHPENAGVVHHLGRHLWVQRKISGDVA